MLNRWRIRKHSREWRKITTRIPMPLGYAVMTVIMTVIMTVTTTMIHTVHPRCDSWIESVRMASAHARPPLTQGNP